MSEFSSPAAASAPVITFASLLAAVSMTVFIDTEMIAFAAAFVWSVGGLFHLPAPVVWALALAIGLPTAWACWRVAVLVFRAETDPANNIG